MEQAKIIGDGTILVDDDHEERQARAERAKAEARDYFPVRRATRAEFERMTEAERSEFLRNIGGVEITD
jgi:hypothetical protein